MDYDMDFIGFTYNGKHSFNDFEIYRTSDGDRYNDDLVPSMKDQSADISGGDGSYFLKTTHNNKVFNVSIAFDKLSEYNYREMRKWLDGKDIHDLIFDEAPYKVYSAKITGTPQLKTICFEQEGERIYKGEGSIQFTCYHPYAHTPNIQHQGFDGRFLENYTNKNKTEWELASGLENHIIGMNKGDLPTPFKIYKPNALENDIIAVGDCIVTIKENCSELEWDSKTGLLSGITEDSTSRKLIKYIGKSYGVISTNGINDLTKIYYQSGTEKICANNKKYILEDEVWIPNDLQKLPFTIEYDYWYY